MRPQAAPNRTVQLPGVRFDSCEDGMKSWSKFTLGAAAAAAVVAYAEFVLDFRMPTSDLAKEGAFGASAYLSLGQYNNKVAEVRTLYGEDRAKVALETSTGRVTVTLDGNQIEEWHIARTFAGIYGVFVIKPRGAPESIFPFALEPGQIPFGHEPNVARLRARFEHLLPAKFLAFSDDDWTRDSCMSPSASESGLGEPSDWLRVRSETFCIFRWNGDHPGSMLISVTLAESTLWMRPFVRRICSKLTVAALIKIASYVREPPTYAACVLVDRADRTGPTGAQDAFKSVVYEIRDGTLARID
jgi:hypothetical protein